MTAHINQSGEEQSLKEHLTHVSELCSRFAETAGVSAMARLIGLLHDMGKGTEAFQTYLKWMFENGDDESRPGNIKHHKHAPTGAIFAYERWFCNSVNLTQKITAQIMILCIYGHHTGLMDCADGDDPLNFQTLMEQDKTAICYQEAVDYYLSNIADEAYLDQLFEMACEELRQKSKMLALKDFAVEENERCARRDFQLGMLTRFLLSVLIDADRWDSACFEYGRDAMRQPDSLPDWAHLSGRYETYARERFTGTGQLDQIRRKISDQCVEKADGETGIYRLSVPTGGGKTFASLRFALKHAKRNRQQRIFYIIPYNTILDQNAKDIREALSQYEGILEHHSNVVAEEDTKKKYDSNVMSEEDTEKENLRYRQLTERWDSDIILTSMVQFLNALFRRENTNARRMHRLANAVLIFDEIQALPRHCKGLFERAVTFLTTCCHSTVLLCTATQLELKLPVKTEELMGTEDNLAVLNRSLKRVEYLPQIERRKTNQQAAERLCALVKEKRSVLMIVNTKAAAWDIYEQTCENLKSAGYKPIKIWSGFEEEAIQEQARHAGDFDILCVHLSTLLCPAHRKEYIRWVVNWTKGGGRTLCVSTALIEAGINVSFPVVVRSLASLPSIVQAAGRCNRNREQLVGEVYIRDLAEENLSRLKEIAQGKDISREIFEQWNKAGYDTLSDPETVRIYYRKEQVYSEKEELYPSKVDPGNTLVGLLSNNPNLRLREKSKSRKSIRPPMNQNFRMAGDEFAVIPQKTRPVLVPYREGEKLILQLNGSHTMEEEIRLLRQIQQYCVNVYDNMYRRLAEEGAIYQVGEYGIDVLKKEYYSEEAGVKTEAGELEEMIL